MQARQLPAEEAASVSEEKPTPKEKLYSTLVNSIDGIVWEADGCTFQFSFVSPQAERILGYPTEAWLADPDFWANHLHPDDRDWCIRFCKEAAAERRDHRFEYRMLTADGRVVWLRDLVTVSEEPGGRICLHGIMFDVTDRKQVEAALRESEQRFRSIFEQSAAGMVMVDESLRFLRANRAYCNFVGRSEEELLQLSAPHLVHPEDREAQVRDVADRPSHIDAIRRHVRKDGAIVWGHSSSVLVEPEEGSPYWVAVMQDITALKQAEQVLRESQEWFRIVANDSPAYLWMTSDEGENSFVNRPLAAFLGTDKTRLGDAWIDYIHPEDRESTLQEFLRCTSEGREFVAQFRLRRSDGAYRWVLDQGLPRRSPSGKLLGYAGYITDITGRKLAEEKLRAAHDALTNELAERRRAEQQILALSDRLIFAQEAERTRLARELHDDLSQEVAAVSILLTGLKRQVREQDIHIREQVERAHSRLTRVAERVRNISHELHPAVLEHAGLTAALRAHCSEFTALTGVHVDLKADDMFADLPEPVSLCVYRIAQEGLQNVAKHARVKSADLVLTREDASVCLTITDKGRGFDVAQVTQTSASLGLISMRERVRLVHGTFELTSSLGAGTTVKACIPVMAPLPPQATINEVNSAALE